jgi:hypothetical protein
VIFTPTCFLQLKGRNVLELDYYWKTTSDRSISYAESNTEIPIIGVKSRAADYWMCSISATPRFYKDIDVGVRLVWELCLRE